MDVSEWKGKTCVSCAAGNQATWGAVRFALHDGPMHEFFASHFPAGTPTVKASARAD